MKKKKLQVIIVSLLASTATGISQQNTPPARAGSPDTPSSGAQRNQTQQPAPPGRDAQTGNPRGVRPAGGANIEPGATSDGLSAPTGQLGQQMVGSKMVKGSDLIGMEVRNMRQEVLGTIRDIAVDIDSGRIAYAVMSSPAEPGQPAAGERFLAIPLSSFRRGDAGENHMILNADKARLATAQGFDMNNWPNMANPAWGSESTGLGAPGAGAATAPAPGLNRNINPDGTPRTEQPPNRPGVAPGTGTGPGSGRGPGEGRIPSGTDRGTGVNQGTGTTRPPASGQGTTPGSGGATGGQTRPGGTGTGTGPGPGTGGSGGTGGSPK